MEIAMGNVRTHRHTLTHTLELVLLFGKALTVLVFICVMDTYCVIPTYKQCYKVCEDLEV